ncbi:GNAT family N-acetyltransferase [Bacillus sp. FJAT-27225]|uniref:GNAT family N-acetyltransferase n=1 Tax=Bacillus sp. FJAT-27225 TaxID=1743144 RepID=UPI001586D991|nr:GNAT family N-acetyltransferase [Bacillus sp. FJAT-27225]
MGYTVAKGYLDNPQLRDSFIQLAGNVFGISFRNWMDKGYLTSNYIPYSFINNEKVIANVSANQLGLLIDGQKKNALQIGTVMTHPDYRGEGLARQLMELVLEDVHGQYDLIYLFANRTVLDFYPKFGFMPVSEHMFSIKLTERKGPLPKMRKLNIDNEEERALLYRLASERSPVSSVFSALGTEELLMFYCLNAFSEKIYYLEEEQLIAIFEEKAREMHVYDLIFQKEMDLKRALSKISGPETRRAVLHFTPDGDGVSWDIEKFDSSEVLFVRKGTFLPKVFKHPLTAQA